MKTLFFNTSRDIDTTDVLFARSACLKDVFVRVAYIGTTNTGSTNTIKYLEIYSQSFQILEVKDIGLKI